MRAGPGDLPAGQDPNPAGGDQPFEPFERVELVDLWHVAVPLSVPFEAAHGIEETRQVVVVRVTAGDGSVGFGECDALSHPTYTHEYAAGAFAVLRDELVPALLAGRSGVDRFHPMARAALGTAQLDAALRRRGVGLAEHLGASRRRLARCAVIGRRGGLDGLLGAVERARADGVALVKLKTSGVGDLRAYRAVRDAFPALALAFDANGSLAGADEDEVATLLDRLDASYLEQPHPAGDLLATAALRRRCAVPIVLDESIGGLADLQVALALGALDGVNVKPARVGGVPEAAHLVRRAHQAGLSVLCGGMVELGIGRAAAAAVAALDGCGWPTDLGPSSAYVAAAAELTEPVGCDDAGLLVVPDGPGIGVEVWLERIERAAVAHASLRRDERR